MIEILFRGKREDGSWCFGSLFEKGNDFLIISGYKQEFGLDRRVEKVIPETVGQFTGLTDKNGTKIFEGDIVSNEHGDLFAVKRSEKHCGFWLVQNGEIEEIECFSLQYRQKRYAEVIGNIHENPELLEVE